MKESKKLEKYYDLTWALRKNMKLGIIVDVFGNIRK